MNYDDKKEITRNNVMLELKKVFINYKEEHCDKFGNLKEGNLDRKHRKTIKDLKTKIEDEKLVCFKTDKTGYLALDTQDNLVKKMEKHIKDDRVIDEKEVRAIERNLNKKTENFLRMTKAGEQHPKQISRIKGNLKVVDNQIPVLSATSYPV